MSDQKKDDKSRGGVRQMFAGGKQNIRDVVPTEAEGDALLDMLFDDAPRSGAPAAPPPPPSTPSAEEPPLEQDEDQPTKIHAADDMAALIDSVRSPRAPTEPAGEVVAPPGWKVSPNPPRAAGSTPGAVPRPAVAPPGLPPRRPAQPPPRPVEAAAPEAAVIAMDEPDIASLDEDERADLTEVGSLPPVDDVALDDEEAIAPRPLSQPPPLPPTRPPPPRSASRAPGPAGLTFPDERDASIVLAGESGLRESYVERARWLRAEAGLMSDKNARARTLLVASELFAMAGEDDEASAVAQEVHTLSSSVSLGVRQHRTLLARSGSWAAALDVMDAEARVMPTPESKCHVAWFSAEVARLAQNDDASAKKRAEQAFRAMPSDPRAHVQRFAEALAASADEAQLARLRPADAQGLGDLSDAFARVISLRGAVRPGEAYEGYEALLSARASLAAGDVPSAVASIRALSGSSIGAAAGWLGGLLAQANKATRASAAALLGVAAHGSHPTLAAKALASAAIEAGGHADMSAAPEAFTDADRTAVAALSGAETASAALDELGIADERELEVLKSVARAVTLPRGADRLSKLDESSIDAPSVLLARSLADLKSTAPYASTSVPAKLARALEAYESDLRSTNGLKGLAFEIDVDARAIDRIATALAGSEADADATSLVAAGFVCELGGDVDSAKAYYDRVLEAGSAGEAILRAALADASSSEVAAALRSLAEALAPGPRKLALLLEAGIRLSHEEDPAEALATFKAASEIEAPIGLASYLGARLSRAAGDQDGLLEWLRLQREGSEDPTERAYDLTREALLLSEAEPAPAAMLLEEALRTNEKDMGLRDLYERIAPDPPADRAAYREARAREAQGPAAAHLAIEAALLYEQQGDLESAARVAKQAEAAGDAEFAPIFANRYALAGFGTAELIDALLPKARETSDAAERLETYERLAELDERGRNDMSSSLLFRRSILEENPTHVRTLRRVTSALMAQGREEEIEPFALDLAKVLEGAEAHAYAALSARLRARQKWEDAAEPVKVAFAQQPRTAWALRQRAAHARANGEHALAAACDRELASRTDRAPEKATLAMRAAESFALAGALDDARTMFEQAVEAAPAHPIPRLGFADLLESAGDFEGAAAQLEAAAELLVTPGWKAEIDYRAGVLREDKLGDQEKARAAFERVFVLDPKNDDVFGRLRKIYVATGARGELAELLERRLDSVEDPAERVEMEVMRGRALAEVGDAGAAKRALLAALESNPDHVDALSAFAELSVADEDYEGAEQALIRLARLTSDAEKQAEIYMRLGDLYDVHIPNADRAEASYQEILKRRPDDIPAREKLVALLTRTQSFSRAVEEQNVLVEGAGTPEMKCQRTIELAEILEQMGENKKAENTLVAARKAYPKSDLALRALVRFYQRTGQGPSAAVMLDRSVADARRALSTGRFEPYLFETLWTAAELRGREDAASVARATVMALEGQPTDLTGAGAAAADATIDDLLAPEVMTPAFRELLLRTGPMLDQAVPFNFDSIRAQPLSSGGSYDETTELASAYGLPSINVLVSPVLGPVCIAATAHPPTVVFGQALATSEESPVRTFLIHRALKVLQSNAAAFARTAPIDLWPLLAAYLKVMNPSFTPTGVDAAKLNEAHTRLARVKPAGLAPDVSTLAADVIGNIGNRASTLNTAVNGWGARAALLAIADPNVALSAIALASGAMNGPPAEGKDRVTWVGRNAEARDLIVFSVSDAYSDARARLGLAG